MLTKSASRQTRKKKRKGPMSKDSFHPSQVIKIHSNSVSFNCSPTKTVQKNKKVD